MKILRVISSVNPKNGGPINGLVNSSHLLVEKGHTVEVACLDHDGADWIHGFDFPLYNFKSIGGKLKYSRSFSRWLESNVSNYDVVIIHGLWQAHGYVTAKHCVKAKVPYVVFSHGMLDPWFNKGELLKWMKKVLYWKCCESFTVNNANKLLFTSQEEMKLARHVFKPYSPNEKVVAYGSATSSHEGSRSESLFYQEFPQLRDKSLGLFLSRVHPKKGIDLIVEAMGKMSSLPDDFMLVIVGPDKEGIREELEKRSVDLRVDTQIFWIDMLEGELKWGAYHAANFFILPSHQENFGIVVAEALSTTTPVLISNKVNIWREIEAGSAGLVEDDSVEGVLRLLEGWWSMSAVEKKRMSHNAGVCYSENFSMQSAVESLELTLVQVAR